ncbi:HD domain-containing protein [Sphingorhabdus sp. EL138]|uniref:HD domain-containing protein n=1 Tax=Sphingorhabdus sp. EL138 TaxID=2073156 RepID=UPI000D68C8BE|nr:HD domain-containing protein [Sphingorhabdus sp. EL138]
MLFQKNQIVLLGVSIVIALTPAHAIQASPKQDEALIAIQTEIAAQIPRTEATLAAESLLEAFSGDVMVAHAKRSYLFAAAFAEREGRKFDQEVVYIASLLHDLGLEDPFDGQGDFETNGAAAARSFLIEKGFDAISRDVEQAIDLHTNPATLNHARYEYALVARGALADVVGAGLDTIDPAKIAKIVRAYPRAGTKSLLIAMLERQAAAKPDSRIAKTYKRLPVSDLIRKAPFSE